MFRFAPVARRGQVPPWALLAVLAIGCGDATQDGTPGASVEETGASDRWAELREGDPARLLEALQRPHARVREALGAHRIETTTDLRLDPATPGPDNPQLDAAVVSPQAVHETSVLRWTPPDELGPRLSLDQQTSEGSKRGVLAVGGNLYTRIDARPWTRFAVETEVHELWLDDVQHTARDAFEFLLRGATVTVEAARGEGWSGGEGLRVQLTRGSGSVQEGSAAWRDGVAFDALDATILIDATTGAWLSVDASATYTVTGGSGGPQNGSLKVSGRVSALSESESSFAAPAEAVALPQRHRYEVERKRLLDGLAAP